MAGVSETTVSVVLGNNSSIIIASETKEKVIQAANQLGYHVNYAAKTMASRKSMTIGVLSPWGSDVWHFAEVLNGIKQVASEKGYGVLLCNNINSQSTPDDCIQYFLENRIDGVVYLPPSTVDLPGVELLHENKVPTVLCNGVDPNSEMDCVIIDYAYDISKAVKHLYQSGFENLLYILPNEFEKLCSGDKDRVLGFDSASCDLKPKSTSKEIFTVDEDIIDRVKKAEMILNKYPKPLGIVSCYWIFAYYIQVAAEKLGLIIDKDIKVISGDSPMFSKELYPKINGINLPFHEIGKLSAEMLINRVEGNSKSIKQIKIKSDFI